MRPEDAEPLRAGFTLLQPDEVRQRFLYALKELTPEMAERFTRIDPRTEFALVAAEPLPPGEALVGAVARVAIDERSHDAEFAILVSRYIANMGLGRYLMTRLVKWARGKKVHRLYGEVFEHNAVDITKPGANLQYRWVIDGHWKLILPHEPNVKGGAPALYDLAKDPTEKENLAAKHADKVAELTKKLDVWWKP